MNIKEIADYLDKIGLQYMATIGLDSKPKVRPVQYMVLHDKKLWFCTNSEKAMYKVFYLADIKGSLNNLGHVKGLKERADFAKPVEFEF